VDHLPIPVGAQLAGAFKDKSLVAELEAGDALYLPKLWWHKVESTAPYTSMLLSMITIAERPAPERAAWKASFDHFVFRSHGHPLAHLPTAEIQG